MQSNVAAPPAVASLTRKCVAIGSGKGGVGKSTTAVNLALLCARAGVRVALVDLDPLSNAAVILDVPESEMAHVPAEVDGSDIPISAYTVSLFPNVDLLFPRQKLSRGESNRVRDALFDRYGESLDRAYDLLIFDMPAGIGHSEHLSFLPYVQTLLVVVQPEPTSQVSAGGYLKAALEIAPDITVLLWHNRFAPEAYDGLPAAQVVAQYNRFVPDDLRISGEQQQKIADFAYLPEDSALNLLQHRYSPVTTLAYRMRGLLEMMQDVLLPPIPDEISASAVSRMRMRRILLRTRGLKHSSASVSHTAEELVAARIDRDLIGEDAEGLKRFRVAVYRYVATVAADPLRRAMLRAIDEANTFLETSAAADGVGPGDRSGDHSRRLEARIGTVLETLGKQMKRRPIPVEIRHGAGVLVFSVSMLKLLRSQSVDRLFRGVVPRRSDDGTTQRRDRRTQIRRLVERDPEYHGRFLHLVRTVYPVVTRQIGVYARATGVESLLLRAADGSVHRSAYLKLLTNFAHEAVHSGLGVVIGMPNTPAYNSAHQAARRLMQRIRSA